VLTFLLTGGLWISHHQLLDPLETHGRLLPGVNLWLLAVAVTVGAQLWHSLRGAGYVTFR
jgi:hypothetical protein